MKLLMVVHGTRGDVQPFVCLALGMKARGHDCLIAAPPNLLKWIECFGISTAPLAVDSQEFLSSEEGRRLLANGKLVSFMSEVDKVTKRHIDEILEKYQALFEQAKHFDVILGGVITEDCSYSMAEHLGLAYCSVHFAPLRRSKYYASTFLRTKPFKFLSLNRLSHFLAEKIWWNGFKSEANAYRKMLGLPAISQPAFRRHADKKIPAIHAFSASLFPKPKDWGEELPIFGALELPKETRSQIEDATHQAELKTWLEEGTAPIYFGMGSMPVLDPEEMMRWIAEVTTALGRRGVIVSGWSNLKLDDSLASRLFLCDAIDHSWLLPQCAAAVHHGGSGTTHAVARAGIPSVVCSIFAAQPFWAARLKERGIATHLPFQYLTPKKLQESLASVLTGDVQKKAKLFSRGLENPDECLDKILDMLEDRFDKRIEKHPEN